jgi:predicted deacylase
MSNLRDLMKNKLFRGLLLLLAVGAVALGAAISLLDHRKPFPVKAGPGVTEIRHLRDYFGPLAKTRGDTEVYLLAGKNPGGTVLILGGTHPNEPAGHLTAVAIVENAVAERGRIFVIPRANASGFTSSDPQEASPQSFSIDTPSGKRRFRYGSRGTSPMDQWPDPDIYLHYPSGQTLSGNQTRNLNRAFPGRPNGNFTERVAFAITELVKREKVDLVIDLHEASPEYPVINAIVAHERAMPLAVAVVMNLELRGIKIALEPSPANLHGLTHRELGDHTGALAVLMETANPAQGRLRGRTTADLIVEGKDKMYVRAKKAGRLFVDFDEGGHPLDRERVARHLAGIEEFLKAFEEANPAKPVEFRNFPPSEKIASGGLGPYLR